MNSSNNKFHIKLLILLFMILGSVLSEYPTQVLEDAFNLASTQLKNEYQFDELQDEMINKGSFVKVQKRQAIKSKTTLHTFVLQTTLESQKIHDSFKIALKASQLLKSNASISLKLPSTFKLKAPPKFCPFAFEPSCDGPLKYRQIDGSCNNPSNSLIGKASTPFKRLLKPVYEDNVEEPKKTGVNGELLPNPRHVAIKIHDPMDTPARITHFGVIFGQFIDHDFAQSAAAGSGLTPFKCTCGSTSENCINIESPEDELFDDQQCMVLTRSAASFDRFDCTISAREQLNTLTHWLDLSQVYGSDLSQNNKLRSFFGGKLKTITINGFDREFLPNTKVGTCVDENGEELCFESGDSRTSENMALVSIHTIWLREHNRIATELRELNPTWSDEDLFQETRRIVIALYQHIIYNEWLPNLVGSELMKTMNLLVSNKQFFMGYNPDTNPHLASEFSTVAFRFGHSLIRSTLSKSDRNLNLIANLTLTNVMLRPTEAYTNGGLDSLCRGLLADPGTSFDPHFTDEIQNHLFESNAFDVPTRRFSLSAINIMRGRDHGIPGYNEFRKLVGLNVAKTFDDLIEIIPDIRERLKKVYKNVNDIDAFTGATSEITRNDALLGPTFANIVARQFRDLKIGDQYYYENGHNATTRFSLPQLNQIRKVTMSSIICNNLDVNLLPKNAFLPVTVDNPLIACTSLKKLSLKKWKNEPLPNRNQFSGNFF